MIIQNAPKKSFYVFCSVALILFLSPALSQARFVTQLVPTLTITEEYTDNYFKTDTNKFEEFTTIYSMGFSLGFIEQNHQVYLEYTPEYKDYKDLDDYDGLDHILSLTGNSTPTKRSRLGYGGRYEDTKADRVGESQESNVFLNGDFQLSQYTDLYFSQKFARVFDQQERTGDYTEYDKNDSSVGMLYNFGTRDYLGLDYTYTFTDYEKEDQDDFDKHKPTVSFAWWFLPKYGMDGEFYYSTLNYDNVGDDADTLSGSLRILREMNQHLSLYVKYRQTQTDRDTGDNESYFPSVGFEWQPTEDSGISIGAGVLFQNWDGYDDYDKERPFVEFDMYKIFNFSRRGSLSLTGASGYGENDDLAASLGFNIYYTAGAVLTYQLTKQLSSDLIASYRSTEYVEPDIERQDNRFNFRAGLSWTPLKWMRISARYEFEDFKSDDNGRDDYRENKGVISVSFIPSTPVRMDVPETREALENKIYGDY